MGTARSGTTILEVLLGSADHSFGAGELTEIFIDGFMKNELCSCGQNFDQCEFWSQVLKEMNLTEKEVERLVNLQKKVDWHSGLVRRFFWGISRTEVQQYKHYNSRLLTAIQSISGQFVLVDSSKYAARALALVGIEEIDLRVICMTRSPAGLLKSFQKRNESEQKGKRPLAVLAYYFVAMSSLRIVSFVLGKKVYQLQYETLVAEPVLTLTSIGEWSQCDLQKVTDQLDQSKEFDVGHIVTGNRLRKKGRLRLCSKPEVLTRFDICSSLTLWSMLFIKWMLGFRKEENT